MIVLLICGVLLTIPQTSIPAAASLGAHRLPLTVSSRRSGKGAPDAALQWIFGLVMAVFLVIPLLVIVPLAFTSSLLQIYPIPAFSFRWFLELFTAPAWQRAIVNSLIIGIGTSV
jgi:ABC-type spermidine/putrescine transport system permease subunit I